jgi:hypothetical protein
MPGAPLIYSGDLRLGGLCLLDTKPRDLTTPEKAELAQMADAVMALIYVQEMDRLGDALKS